MLVNTHGVIWAVRKVMGSYKIGVQVLRMSRRQQGRSHNMNIGEGQEIELDDVLLVLMANSQVSLLLCMSDKRCLQNEGCS